MSTNIPIPEEVFNHEILPYLPLIDLYQLYRDTGSQYLKDLIIERIQKETLDVWDSYSDEYYEFIDEIIDNDDLPFIQAQGEIFHEERFLPRIFQAKAHNILLWLFKKKSPLFIIDDLRSQLYKRICSRKWALEPSYDPFEEKYYGKAYLADIMLRGDGAPLEPEYLQLLLEIIASNQGISQMFSHGEEKEWLLKQIFDRLSELDDFGSTEEDKQQAQELITLIANNPINFSQIFFDDEDIVDRLARYTPFLEDLWQTLYENYREFE